MWLESLLRFLEAKIQMFAEQQSYLSGGFGLVSSCGRGRTQFLLSTSLDVVSRRLYVFMYISISIYFNTMSHRCKKVNKFLAAWVTQWVKWLPSAQVMISGSWDRAPHWAPCSAGSLLLHFPLPSPVFPLSLCLPN